jgi:UDP-N-acetylmuramyl pentapeptide phosphotransferase/UDP-N-acetylglucosamine-1-phosphate transferase
MTSSGTTPTNNNGGQTPRTGGLELIIGVAVASAVIAAYLLVRSRKGLGKINMVNQSDKKNSSKK